MDTDSGDSGNDKKLTAIRKFDFIKKPKLYTFAIPTIID
jgi:hypothetical protein